MTQPRQIILDTDPGGDDSIALLWLQSLAKQGLAAIVAITAVDGNVGAPATYSGASKLLSLGGFAAIEVGRGILGGSQYHREDARAIHGADGMGNLSQTLPAVTRPYEEARPADEVLMAHLQAQPGQITIVAIGPLTNLAAAEQKSPGILQLAKQIVMMGGAFLCPGNVTPDAEFNIAYDPIAAQTVFNSREDLVILPLDITRQILFTPEMAAQVAAVAPTHAISQFIVRLCDFMTQTALAYRETRGLRGFPVHDAATLAYLFYPETLLFRRAQVWVETTGDWTTGKTGCDRRPTPKSTTNAWIAWEVDAPALLAHLQEDLKFLIANT